MTAPKPCSADGSAGAGKPLAASITALSALDCGDSSLTTRLQQRALTNQEGRCATRSSWSAMRRHRQGLCSPWPSGSGGRASAPGVSGATCRSHSSGGVARLAVCRSVQDEGHRSPHCSPMRLSGCWQASNTVGCCAGIVVHAGPRKPGKLLSPHGFFDPSPIDPDTLLIVSSDVAATLPF